MGKAMAISWCDSTGGTLAVLPPPPKVRRHRARFQVDLFVARLAKRQSVAYIEAKLRMIGIYGERQANQEARRAGAILGVNLKVQQVRIDGVGKNDSVFVEL